MRTHIADVVEEMPGLSWSGKGSVDFVNGYKVAAPNFDLQFVDNGEDSSQKWLKFLPNIWRPLPPKDTPLPFSELKARINGGGAFVVFSVSADERDIPLVSLLWDIILTLWRVSASRPSLDCAHLFAMPVPLGVRTFCGRPILQWTCAIKFSHEPLCDEIERIRESGEDATDCERDFVQVLDDTALPHGRRLFEILKQKASTLGGNEGMFEVARSVCDQYRIGGAEKLDSKCLPLIETMLGMIDDWMRHPGRAVRSFEDVQDSRSLSTDEAGFPNAFLMRYGSGGLVVVPSFVSADDVVEKLIAVEKSVGTEMLDMTEGLHFDRVVQVLSRLVDDRMKRAANCLICEGTPVIKGPIDVGKVSGKVGFPCGLDANGGMAPIADPVHGSAIRHVEAMPGENNGGDATEIKHAMTISVPPEGVDVGKKQIRIIPVWSDNYPISEAKEATKIAIEVVSESGKREKETTLLRFLRIMAVWAASNVGGRSFLHNELKGVEYRAPGDSLKKHPGECLFKTDKGKLIENIPDSLNELRDVIGTLAHPVKGKGGAIYKHNPKYKSRTEVTDFRCVCLDFAQHEDGRKFLEYLKTISLVPADDSHKRAVEFNKNRDGFMKLVEEAIANSKK